MVHRNLSTLTALLTVFATPAFAYHHGSGQTPISCPFTASAASDGCSAAPPYVNATLSFLDPNLFNDARQSGQTYTAAALAAINFNVAGQTLGYYAGVRKAVYCNAAAGIPCSPSSNPDLQGLIDPTAYPWSTDPANTGCSKAYSGYSGGQVTCQLRSNTTTTLQGFDWSVNGCTQVYLINDTTTGTAIVHITDSYFNVGPACASSIPWRLDLNNASIDFSYNAINGNMTQPYVVSNVNLATPVSMTTEGGVTINHNYVLDDPARMFSAFVGTYGSSQGNVFHNEGALVTNDHGEHIAWYDRATGDTPALSSQNDTMWTDVNTGPANTAQMVASPAVGATFSSWTVNEDVIITNVWTYTTALIG